MSEMLPSWLEVSRLIDAYASAANIGGRVRAIRLEQRDEHGRKWSLDVLAKKVAEHTQRTQQLKQTLGRDALSRIETGDRQVSTIEAVVLSSVLGTTLAELLLPDGAIEEAEDWRLLEDAAIALSDVRNAAKSYELAMGKLRNRVKSNDKLREHVVRTHRAEAEKDDESHRANYDRHARVKSLLEGAPIEEDPMPPFEEWRTKNFLPPTPLHVTSEHALSDGALDSDLWYLGWSAPHMKQQFRWRIRGHSDLSPDPAPRTSNAPSPP